MLRLILALLALISPAMSVFTHERSTAPATTEPDWIALDYTMPGSDGWVATAITAQTDSVLDIRYTSPGEDPSQSTSAMLFMTPLAGDDRFNGFSASWGSSTNDVQINVQGQRVICCDLSGLPAIFADAGGRGNGSVGGLWLTAGETLWATMVVAHSDVAAPPIVEYRITQGSVSVGERRDGTSVSLVDLPDDAWGHGVNVGLGATRIGVPGTSDHAWMPATNGLLFAMAWPQGGASAKLSVRAAGTDVLSDRLIAGEEPTMVFAMGLGDYGARLTDLQEPTNVPGFTSYAQVGAVTLYADLDVPGSGITTYPQES